MKWPDIVILWGMAMDKKRVCLWALAMALFAIAGPFVINWCYQCDAVIITTKWGAADMLSYYGTLLGATATILTLACTISFTRKQIQRERFLERNRSKWEMVESIIMQALLDISPLKMCSFDNSGNANVMIQNRISGLQSYAATAKTSLDRIKCYINPDEYKQIADYVAEISCAIMQFCKIEDELAKEYMTLQTIAINNNGTIPNEEKVLHFARTNEIMEKIPIAHSGLYQRLLDRKRDVFEKIYADIDAQADQLLRFGRKK